MYTASRLFIVVLTVLVIGVFVGCGPSDEELAALVEAEVAKQVALVPPAPPGEVGPEGPQGPQGVEGPQGLIGPQGPQGLTGPPDPQGVAGPQGRAGPEGSVGLRGPEGERGPMGPPAPIPQVLEVEELIVRADNNGGYMRLVGGAEGRVAVIQWYHSDGVLASEIWGGSTEGMVLRNRQDDQWSEFCIAAGRIGPCPP